MYFAEQYERLKSYPKKMLDTNIASDYTKVRKIFVTNSDPTIYLPLLKQLTNEGTVQAQITDIFNFEKVFEEEDIVSLLFYMGWLTIEDTEEGQYIFKIPNRVIQELYYDYFVVIKEARQQLNGYLQTDNAKRIENLKAWLLILVGREWRLVEEVPVV